MLTVFVILGLLKLISDQRKEDTWFSKYPVEEFDKETYDT